MIYKTAKYIKYYTETASRLQIRTYFKLQALGSYLMSFHKFRYYL